MNVTTTGPANLSLPVSVGAASVNSGFLPDLVASAL
jgi:hypothetical protein